MKEPNAFGCYDMLGNVWEWCSDPAGKKDKNGKTAMRYVARGGGHLNQNTFFLRASVRGLISSTRRVPDGGFRVARDP